MRTLAQWYRFSLHLLVTLIDGLIYGCFILTQALVQMPKPNHHEEDSEGADAICELLWKHHHIEVHLPFSALFCLFVCLFVCLYTIDTIFNSPWTSLFLNWAWWCGYQAKFILREMTLISLPQLCYILFNEITIER